MVFELTPNSPEHRELIDTSVVRLWAHDQLVYDRVHSVRNLQMRHSYVQMIAKAFCCCRDLIGKEIYSSCKEAANTEAIPTFLSLVHITVSSDWLTVSLAAARTQRLGEVVHVDLFLQQAKTEVGDVKNRREGKWSEWQNNISARIICRPEDAITFGTQLLTEVDQVEMLRIAFDLPEYDDPSYNP
jgi:hypothetical protein